MIRLSPQLTAPAHLRLTAIANGFAPSAPTADFAYAEIVCRRGMALSCLAAAHPDARFFGIDRRPASIEAAIGFAARAGLANAEFRQTDFTELAGLDLPPLDYAVVNRVLPFHEAEAREAMLRFAVDRLKSGGILYVAYHALPGWAAAAPLRDMMGSLSLTASGNPADQADQALTFMRRARAAGAPFFADQPQMAALIDAMSAGDQTLLPLPDGLTGPLRAFHFREISGPLAHAGLNFAGNADADRNQLDLCVAPALRPLFDDLSSRAEFEAKRDFLNNAGFRRDVYVKGAAEADPEAFLSRQLDLVFAVAQPPDHLPETVRFAGGSLDRRAQPFAALIDRLHRRPDRLKAAAADCGLDRETAVDAMRLLHAGGLIQPLDTLPDGSDEAGFGPSEAGLTTANRAILKKLIFQADAVPLAAPEGGTVFEADPLEALLLLSLDAAGPAGAMQYALTLCRNCEQDLMAGGKAASEPEARALLERALERLQDRLPILIRYGALAPR